MQLQISKAATEVTDVYRPPRDLWWHVLLPDGHRLTTLMSRERARIAKRLIEQEPGRFLDQDQRTVCRGFIIWVNRAEDARRQERRSARHGAL